MKHFRCVAVMAASLSLAFAMPALAQDSWPMESGDYVEVSSIEIDDGHGLEYAQFLASSWKRNQEFAKAQGWITGYEVLTNEFARKGEPDLYLVIRFANFVDKAEEEKRAKAYRAHAARTIVQLQAESAGRATYRHQAGTMLLRQQNFKN